MKKVSRRSFLQASGLLAAAALTGCGDTSSGSTAASAASSASGSSSSGKHEPITMMLPFNNITPFLKTFNAEYPDIDLEIIPYSGYNTTAFVREQLKAGILPDIYFTTTYDKEAAFSEHLLDLSTYPFIDNYSESFLRDVREDTGVYLLPSVYNAFGITYNKTLLEKNGWAVPTSMQEMEELAEKVRDTGLDLSITLLNLPGYGFQYLYNTLSSGWFSTLEGLKWQDSYLEGDATMSGSPEMMEDLQHFEHYCKLGLLNNAYYNKSDSVIGDKMCEGNTLFMFGSSNNFFTREGVNGTFGLMPYLSEDGTHNVFISNVSRYFGLNKALGEPGNEQKLEDALTFLTYISTQEGMTLLTNAVANNYILPLKDYTPSEDSFFLDIKDDLDAGMVSPLITGGRWSNTVVPVGNTVLDYINGKAALDDIVKSVDDSKALMDSDAVYCTTVTETVDMDACAQWVGIAYAQATGADFALMSKNKWYELDSGKLNPNGVNGCLYPVPITDEEIVAVIPHSWSRTIETIQLTGREVNDLLASGYDYDGTGEHNYPYTLVAPDGFILDESRTYTVVCCGMADALKESHEVVDTGVVGLDAAHTYLSQFDTFSPEDIHWN